MAWINNFQIWLSESQSLANAQMIVNFLTNSNNGWTKESIAAVIGNMRHESSVNPNMYEYGYGWSEDRGFGLVQWTPRSKFWDWGIAEGYTEAELRSGDSQLARLNYEVENNIQYLANGHELRYGRETKYNFSFADFRSNAANLTLNELVEAFMWNYEGPAYSAGTASLSERQAFANRAFNELDWETLPEPTNNEPIPDISEMVNQINDVINEGKSNIENQILANVATMMTEIYDKILATFSSPITYNSNEYKSNNLFVLTKLYNNVDKISPTTNLKDLFQTIITDAASKVDGGLSDILDNISSIVNDVPVPVDNEPRDVMYFPVDYTLDGINFWKRANYVWGDLQFEMTYGEREGGFHSGYDIGSSGNLGYKIYAVRDGVVKWSGYKDGGIGNCIYIEHSSDDLWSNYMHLDSMIVAEGDTVKAGQEIGVMGNSGGNYAVHLHFEISPDGNFHSGGNTQDPEPYLEVTADNTTTLKIPKGV